MPNVTIAIPENKYLYDYNKDAYEVGGKSFTIDILTGLARYNDSLKYVDIHNSEFLLRPSEDTDYQQSVDPSVLELNGIDSSYEIQKDSILLNKGLPKSFDKGIAIRVDLDAVKGNSLN